jgi:Flp pilus assembly protein TadG
MRAGFWRAASGVSSVEFALTAPMLAVVMIGLVDFSRFIIYKMEVGAAARAAAAYVDSSGYNTTGISNAVANATGLKSLTVTPSQVCGCANATSGISTATCGAACNSGGTSGTYAKISTQVNYTTIFEWPGVSQPVTVSATAMVRTK